MRAAPALAGLLALLAAGPAFGHATLLASDPADGALVETAPTALTLSFNEQPEITALTLVGPDGAATALHDFALSGNEVVIAAPPLERGTQVLTWRAVSVDGHPIGSAVIFSVGAVTGAAVEIEPTDPLLGALIWLGRVLLSVGLLVGVGGAFFAAWVDRQGALPRLGHRLLRIAIGIGIVALPPAFLLQGADLVGGGVGAVFSPDAWAASLRSTYTRTLGLAGVALVLALAGLSWPAWGRVLTAGGLLALGAAIAASGHASSAPPTALTTTLVVVHATTVAFWVGALLPLAVILARWDGASFAALRRFSAAIPFAIVPLVAAGIGLSVVQLEAVSALWTTDYGKVLVAKLALVAALLVIAAVNRFWLTPAKEQGGGGRGRALRWTATAELVLVVLVLSVVALWRFTPPPRALALSQPAAPVTARLQTPWLAADITLTPGGVGPVTVAIDLMTGELQPLAAGGLTLGLANEPAGIGRIERRAMLREDGVWQVDGLVLPVGGAWTVDLAAVISAFDVRFLDGMIGIGPEGEAAVAAFGADPSAPGSMDGMAPGSSMPAMVP